MNELIPITNQKEIEKIFLSDGLMERIEAIKTDALNYVSDISTAIGRKACASEARGIASQKVIIDNAGKDLKEEYKRSCDRFDAVRKTARDTLDSVRDTVRAPLDAWEKAEEERIEKERQEIEYQLAWDEAIREKDLYNRKKDVERREAELERKRLEQEQKEREEAAEKKRIAREEEIARQAKERAEKAAQAAIEAEKNRYEAAEKKAAADKAKAAKDKIEAELRAKFAAEKVERDKKEALEKAAREKLEAIENAKREEIERQTRERIAAERKAAEEARIAKEKAENIEHQKKINGEAVQCFVACLLTQELSEGIIKLISEKSIKHVTINY